MSFVTNVILCCYGGTCYSPTYINKLCTELNTACFTEDAIGFVPYDIGSLTKELGGSKSPVGLILVAGFNLLMIDSFVESLKKFAWDDFLYSVDLFLLREDDEDGYRQEKIHRSP